MSEPFEDVQMALHDAVNTCVCDGHNTAMVVSEMLGGSGLVEAIAAIVELLVVGRRHCRYIP